jgi:hypothetical protein
MPLPRERARAHRGWGGKLQESLLRRRTFIEHGFVHAQESFTTVRIPNTDTGKIIVTGRQARRGAGALSGTTQKSRSAQM